MNHSDDFVAAALNVAEAGRGAGIPLRVLGACAVRIHSPLSKSLLDQMGRSISDLDFISTSKYESKITPFFKQLGYKSDSEASKYYAHMYGMLRDRFRDSNTNATLDVFYDRLEMCHTIELSKRLEVDYPTISLSDILLEKMQIVKINQKDIQDTLVLFREHAVSESDNDSFNSRYLGRVLSEDWGFYYTVTTNLQKLKEHIATFSVLNDSADMIREKIDGLLKVIEAEPKSLKWKWRAKVGTKQKWYKDVDEVSMGPAV